MSLITLTKMDNDTSLARELLALAASYRGGCSSLPALASRAETLIEQMRGHLPADVFSGAMNSVCLIEEINAVILDENRPLTDGERAMIDRQLDCLVELISPVASSSLGYAGSAGNAESV